MAKKKKPVAIWGIEFDALIDEQKTLSSTIPVYPVEKGLPVSDTIINDPVSLQLTLYVSNTPVTWLYRHGSSMDRVTKICKKIEKKWMERKLTKIVTTDAIYKSMGITCISIKKSRELGYAREVTVAAQKVRITKRRTVTIPSYVLKSGASMANAGKAATSGTSKKASGGGAGSSGGSGTKSSTSKKGGTAKKSKSILYGAADGLGLI